MDLKARLIEGGISDAEWLDGGPDVTAYAKATGCHVRIRRLADSAGYIVDHYFNCYGYPNVAALRYALENTHFI